MVLSNLDIDDETILFARVDEQCFQILSTYQILFQNKGITFIPQSTHSSQFKINLPKLMIPQYDGNPLLWSSFCDNYIQHSFRIIMIYSRPKLTLSNIEMRSREVCVNVT